MRIFIFLLLLAVCLCNVAWAGDGAVKTVKTAVDEEFTITLAANATTGYEWRIADTVNGSIIKLTNSKYVPDNTGLVGSGGKSMWTFRAVRPGKARISFEYIRPWEKNTPPAKEEKYAIDVQNEVREHQ